jgi:hypothetical protein
MEVGCTLLDTWREVRDATISILERKTFADLARRAAGPWKPAPLEPTKRPSARAR